MQQQYKQTQNRGTCNQIMHKTCANAHKIMYIHSLLCSYPRDSTVTCAVCFAKLNETKNTFRENQRNHFVNINEMKLHFVNINETQTRFVKINETISSKSTK